MLGSRVQHLLLAIARELDLHQRLDAERRERRVDPSRTGRQNPVNTAGEITDLANTARGEHTRLAREAVKHLLLGADRERR